jgi:6-pyruvoyltetrahydropterin/6-carboxytetrahydropterin synthase
VTIRRIVDAASEPPLPPGDRSMPLTLERRYRFSAAHRYFRPEWSEEENFRRFGKCAFAPGHGHNYRLTIEVRGEVDPVTGFVADLLLLDQWIHRRVLEPLDHRHLNDAIPEFASGRLIPSSENLVLWIRNQIREGLPNGATLASVRVAEDDDLAASWREGGDTA